MAEPTAFKEGVDAYGRGVPRGDCPYPEESDQRQEWLDGWDEAESIDEDEEI